MKMMATKAKSRIYRRRTQIAALTGLVSSKNWNWNLMSWNLKNWNLSSMNLKNLRCIASSGKTLRELGLSQSSVPPAEAPSS